MKTVKGAMSMDLMMVILDSKKENVESAKSERVGVVGWME